MLSKRATLRCVNAGHEYPALLHENGEYELIKQKHSPPLGSVEGIPFSEYEIQLDPGDCLFVYTDGVPEAINMNVEAYGTDRMLIALNLFKEEPMDRLLPAVKEDLDIFVGEAEQFDDVTMLGFKLLGTEKRGE